MNIVNNKRKKESIEKIEKAFIELLQTKEVKDIFVSDICKISKINRSTFYANYIDIYDLVDKLKEKMMNDFFSIYADEVKIEKHSYNFLKLFQNIKDNQIFYKTYFKLNFEHTWDDDYLTEELLKWYGTTENGIYHIIFFKAGLNAIIKYWLDNGCKESPEEIEKILKEEYNKKMEIIN